MYIPSSKNSRISRRQWLLAPLALAGCRSVMKTNVYGHVIISESLELTVIEPLAPFDYSGDLFFDDRTKGVIQFGQRDLNGRPHRLNNFVLGVDWGLGNKIIKRQHVRSVATGPMGGWAFELDASFWGFKPRSHVGAWWGFLPGELENQELPILGQKPPARLGRAQGLMLTTVLRYQDLLVSASFIYDPLGARRTWGAGIAPVNPGDVTEKNEPDWITDKLIRFKAAFDIGLPVYAIDDTPPIPLEEVLFGCPAQLNGRLESVVPASLRPKGGPLPVDRQYVFLIYDRGNWIKQWSQVGSVIREQWLTYPVRPENEILQRHEPEPLYVD
jgi:hypothetical protein